MEASNQLVVMTAIGAVTALGVTYMITASNNTGKTGQRNGNIKKIESGARSEDGTDFEIDLPTGIDFSAGVYEFQIQLPIELASVSEATDPGVKFKSISPDQRRAIMSQAA